jgi:hypothetical protein
MAPSCITHSWFALLGSAAMLAVVLTALGLMIGLVKSADIQGKFGAIVGVFVVLTILPGILIGAWVRMSLGQQITLVGIGILVWLRPHRRASRKRIE